MELSREILEEVFQIAQQVDRGEIAMTKGRDNLVRAFGFNANSANILVRSLRHLLNGERYRRAMTLDATDYFLGRIREVHGSQGLQKRWMDYLPISITATQQGCTFPDCRQSLRNIPLRLGEHILTP